MFGRSKKKSKRGAPRHPAMKAQQKKMKSCAVEWSKGKSKKSSYKSHMADCLGK